MALTTTNFTIGLEDLETALRNMSVMKDSKVYKFGSDFSVFSDSKIIVTESKEKYEVEVKLTFDKLKKIGEID